MNLYSTPTPDAELGAYLLLGQKAVFLRLHVNWQEFLAGGVDGVNNKLMEVGKRDVEQNIRRNYSLIITNKIYYNSLIYYK